MGGSVDPALRDPKGSSAFGIISIPVAILAASGDLFAEVVIPKTLGMLDGVMAEATVRAMAFWLHALVAALVLGFLGLKTDRHRGFAIIGLLTAVAASVLLFRGFRCLGLLLAR